MFFHSLLYIYCFLPVTLLLYYFCRERLRNIILFFASLIFSSWFQVSLTFVLIASITLNYFAGIAIERASTEIKRRSFFVLAVIVNLALLGIFKYLVFISVTLSEILSLVGMSPFIIKEFGVPLGISFYTFKGISYLISVKRRENSAQKQYINLAVYLAIFPEFIAGPIDRYGNLAPQLINPACSLERFTSGIKRFAIGLAKKVIIATPLAMVADKIFGSPVNQLTVTTAWLGAICYTLQIYYDFAGYTDMAIGTGKMFGLTFAENFNFPYVALSVRDFWRRWHMTLSSWLRDYLFLPLAYARSKKMVREKYFHFKTERWIYIYATLITFLLCGLWHGAAWTFIVWGLLHGVMLVAEQSGLGKILKRTYKPVQHFYLIFFLIISWIFFRSPSVRDAICFLGLMFGSGVMSEDFTLVTGYLDIHTTLVLCISILGATPFFAKLLEFVKSFMKSRIMVVRATVTHLYYFSEILLVLLMFVLSTIFIIAGTTVPFIYFKF
jgi:alginate O-acetyltransferase complex protein AlgI